MGHLELTDSANLILRERLPIDRHPVSVYLVSLRSKSSRRVHASALKSITKLLDMDVEELAWHRLRHQHVAAIAGMLADEYSPAPANRFLSVLKGVLKQSWLLGLMDAEEYYRWLEVKGSTEERAAGRSLAIGEIRALFENCRNQKGFTELIDGAILALMGAAGLRRSEIVGLNIADYEFSTGAITARRGKGRKDRMVYINNGANRETTSDIATTTPISRSYNALDPFRKSPADPG